MDNDPFEVTLTGDGHRYVATLGGQEVGHAEIDPIGADAIIIKHTEISPEFEGRGLAGKLVKAMLEDSRSRGRTVIPVCPYAAAWIKKHPEYLEYVRPSYRAVLTRA